MSISSRITEMEQHIGNAYDKIEDLGIDLTNVDKNIDNIATMLENVWNEYPKVTATDVEEATLNGTKKGRMEIELKGNTKQDTYTGKNKFNQSSISKLIKNGTSSTNGITNSNNIIAITYSNGQHGRYAMDYLMPITSGQVTVSFQALLTGTNDNKGILVGIFNVDGSIEATTGIQLTATAKDSWYNYTATFTLNEYAENGINLDIQAWNTGNSIQLKNIQIEKGSATSYEPYCGGIPSPNPDFPQQIKNVTGNANVLIQNKNLLPFTNNQEFTLSGVKFKTVDGKLILDGTSTGGISSRDNKFKENFTFELDAGVYYLETFSDDNTLIMVVNPETNENFRQRRGSFTLTKKQKVYIGIYIAANITFDNYEAQYQVEQGSTATSYVLHQEQNLPFSFSENLFDFEYIKNHKNDFIKNGQYFAFYKLDNSFKTEFNVTTILKGTNQNLVMGFSDSIFATSHNELRTLNNGTIISPKTFDFSNSENVYFFIANSNTLATGLPELDVLFNNYNVQVEQNYDIRAMEGTTLEDDGIHQKRKQLVLDGTETYSLFSQNTSRTVFILTNNLISEYTNSSEIPDIQCTHFSAVKQATTWKPGDLSRITNNRTSIMLIVGPDVSLEQFKAWISQEYAEGHPIILEIPLKDEETIPYNSTQQTQYNAIKQARSYDDITYITSTSDELEFKMDVECLRKKEN